MTRSTYFVLAKMPTGTFSTAIAKAPLLGRYATGRNTGKDDYKNKAQFRGCFRMSMLQ